MRHVMSREFGARVQGNVDAQAVKRETPTLARLFEEDMRAPFKDGIVRLVPWRQISEGPETKLNRSPQEADASAHHLQSLYDSRRRRDQSGESYFRKGQPSRYDDCEIGA
jgi:hypothetical protein